jgi:hypothetical protein
MIKETKATISQIPPLKVATMQKMRHCNYFKMLSTGKHFNNDDKYV